MIDFDKLKMKGDWCLVEKDQSRTHQLIVLPDSANKYSPMGRILKLAPNAPKSLGVGQLIIEKTNSKWKKAHSLKDSKTEVEAYIVPWGEIMARILNQHVIPIGRRVLVERLPIRSTGVIHRLDKERANLQNLMVTVKRYGLCQPGEEFKMNELPLPGSICKIKQWEMHQFELGIVGKYHLIVNEDDLEYQEIA